MTTNRANKKPASIAYQIREFRKRKNYSQTQLARKWGVDKTTISAWERDIRFPSEDYLMVIAEFIGITVNEILLISKNRRTAG